MRYLLLLAVVILMGCAQNNNPVVPKDPIPPVTAAPVVSANITAQGFSSSDDGTYDIFFVFNNTGNVPVEITSATYTTYSGTPIRPVAHTTTYSNMYPYQYIGPGSGPAYTVSGNCGGSYFPTYFDASITIQDAQGTSQTYTWNMASFTVTTGHYKFRY